MPLGIARSSKMKPHRRVYVVGGAHTNYIGKFHPDFIWKKHPDFGVKDNPTLEQHLHAAILATLEETGVEAAQIQKGYVGNFVGELFVNQGHLGAMAVAAHEGLHRKPFGRTEAACASGGIAVLGCVDAIQAGYDVTLATGAEVQTTVNARVGADYLARAAHYATERDIDEFTFPAMFARRAKAYKEATGTTAEDISPVVVKAYENGNKNPNAHMRSVQMTLDQVNQSPVFVGNEEYRAHLRLADCSQVSDGASGIILASEEGLAQLGISKDQCTELVSYGHATSPLGQVEDLTRLDNTMAAVQEAYRDAGVGAGDMQIAEVHDCFSITELMMYEAAGFAPFGGAAALAKDGATTLGGRIPVNTGGGLLSFGHPVGATGVKQVLEIHRQMKGLCGDYQMSTLPGLGLTINMGGDDRTTVTTIQRNHG
jgi:acetyl-CoA acyltransferase